MMSGEHFLASEASAVARTILLEVDKINTVKTRDAYTRSWAMSPNYRGVTPRFIHWFLNQDHAKIKELVEKYHSDLQTRSSGKQNSSRIALNLSLNYLCWYLFVDFMADSGVVDRKEADELKDEHWGYVLKCQSSMLGRCEDEQSAIVFMRFLRQLIASKQVSIANLDGHYNEHKQQIGFVAPGSPGQVNLFPDITFTTVRSFARDTGIAGTERSIAKQLVDMEVICATDPARNKRLVRYGGSRQRVWTIDLEHLGFEVKPEIKAQQAQVLQLHPSEPAPKMDENGIF
jgi:hypothetical protein